MEEQFEQAFSRILGQVQTEMGKAFAFCAGPDAKLDVDARLSELGLDSLGMVEFEQELSKNFEIEELAFNERDIREAVENDVTVERLARSLAARHASLSVPRTADEVHARFIFDTGKSVSSTKKDVNIADIDAMVCEARHRLFMMEGKPISSVELTIVL